MLDLQLSKSLPDIQTSYTKWSDIESAWANRCELSGHHWIFRGQSVEKWTFQSTLERAIWKYSEIGDDVFEMTANVTENERRKYQSKISNLQRKALKQGIRRHFVTRPGSEFITTLELEKGLIRRFQRQCHHYMQDTPREDDILEWLALMRHYGAPTRMLDWTWSFFVALFFAIQRAESTSIVWGLDLNMIDPAIPLRIRKMLRSDTNARKPKTFSEIFDKKQDGVITMSPHRLNERLVIQQSTFLIPTNVTVPFDDNLTATLLKAAQLKAAQPALLKFKISGHGKVRRELLRRLHRMNISAATLLPGLDGFAQSLEQLFAFPDVIRSMGRLRVLPVH